MPDVKVTSSIHPTHVSFPAPNCILLWVEKKGSEAEHLRRFQLHPTPGLHPHVYSVLTIYVAQYNKKHSAHSDELNAWEQSIQKTGLHFPWL